MSTSDDDRFRIRLGAPKSRPPKFVSQVLKEASKAGSTSLKRSARKLSGRPGARLGRGHTAARFSGHSLQPGSRRVTIKTRLVNLKQAGMRSTSTHLRYIEREGVGRTGEPGQAYGATIDKADLAAFEEQGRGDRHQFRFIVSPEDAAQLDDLRSYTRHLMARMEADLGTHLDWVAIDHWNTDNPHTHIVLRGKDATGKDLIISRDYIAQGMRERASGLATEWLGLRTERDMQGSGARGRAGALDEFRPQLAAVSAGRVGAIQHAESRLCTPSAATVADWTLATLAADGTGARSRHQLVDYRCQG
jgi:hypothetical protein